jgi:hypothetical protein
MEQAHRTAAEKRVSGSDSLTEQKITGFYPKAQLKETIMSDAVSKAGMKGGESARTNVVTLQSDRTSTDGSDFAGRDLPTSISVHEFGPPSYSQASTDRPFPFE